MNSSPAIVWFRRDLRIDDNPALNAALEHDGPVLPVFIDAPQEEGAWPLGGASRWWLHHALCDLREALSNRGLTLLIQRGESLGTLRELARLTGAKRLFWNRRYEPAITKRDSRIKSALRDDGLTVRSFNGALMWEPHETLNQQGRPYQVFTPYWKNLRTLAVRAPLICPDLGWDAMESPPRGLTINDLNLLPEIPWDEGIAAAWTPTVAGAREQLDLFVGAHLGRYSDYRNRPDRPGTSRLSPYLASGLISPRQIWSKVMSVDEGEGNSGYKFLSEIGWREFSYHLMVHFPETPERALRANYRQFPWEPDSAQLGAWQRGETGYPIVDAGMRQLWQTGWMHNRVRMIVASVLVKHLLQPWQEGARWFWDTLVDADLASNTQGWQWTAGCGADAAPYFRIFNPMLQGEKFDPQGAYVRRYVPELEGLAEQHIHTPWEAPDGVLRKAGVKLDENYPRPIIAHKHGRQRALDALKTNRSRER